MRVTRALPEFIAHKRLSCCYVQRRRVHARKTKTARPMYDTCVKFGETAWWMSKYRFCIFQPDNLSISMSFPRSERRRGDDGRIRLDSTDRRIMRLFKGRKFSFAALGRGESIFAQSLPLPALRTSLFVRRVTSNLLIEQTYFKCFFGRISKLLSRFKSIWSIS